MPGSSRKHAHSYPQVPTHVHSHTHTTRSYTCTPHTHTHVHSHTPTHAHSHELIHVHAQCMRALTLITVLSFTHAHTCAPSLALTHRFKLAPPARPLGPRRLYRVQQACSQHGAQPLASLAGQWLLSCTRLGAPAPPPPLSPVDLRLADELEGVFPGFGGLKDQVEFQSLQWQDRSKPIVGLDVHKLRVESHHRQRENMVICWGCHGGCMDTRVTGVGQTGVHGGVYVSV